jgi:hypothetical protein
MLSSTLEKGCEVSASGSTTFCISWKEKFLIVKSSFADEAPTVIFVDLLIGWSERDSPLLVSFFLASLMVSCRFSLPLLLSCAPILIVL